MHVSTETTTYIYIITFLGILRMILVIITLHFTFTSTYQVQQGIFRQAKDCIQGVDYSIDY